MQKKISILGYVPIAAYLVLIPFMGIEFVQIRGTMASTGTAAFIGFGLAFIYKIPARKPTALAVWSVN